MQRHHPLTSIRWQLPLSYALIALVAALALSMVLITLLRQHYIEQELALLNRTAVTLDNIISHRVTAPLTAETVPLELSDLSAFLDVRIEALSPEMTLLSDTGIPESFTVTMGNVAYPVMSTYAVEARPRPSVVITGGEFTAMSTALPPAQNYMLSGDIVIPAEPLDTTMTLSADGQELRIDNSAGIAVMAAEPSDDRGFTNRHNFFPFNRFAQASVFFDTAPVEVSVDSGRVWLVQSQKRSDQEVLVGLVSPYAAQPLGFLRVSALPAIGTEIVNSVAQGALIAGMAAVTLAGAAGYFISQRLTAPLSKLESAAHDMAIGEYWVRVDIKRSDELGKLADAFNGMAQQVESTVSALRRFVADAAHELHTPLTSLRADLELAREQPSPAQVKHALKQASRLETLCDDLLDLSRLESPKLFWQNDTELVAMDEMMEELGEIYASRAEQEDIDFSLEVASSLPALSTGNPSQIRRALGNLLDNALKFTPTGGCVKLSAHPTDSHLSIHITDSGIGIPPTEIERVFDHFYRGSNTHDYPGSGLGLAITHAIVKSHGGRIEVDSDATGTHFCVTLPKMARL